MARVNNADPGRVHGRASLGQAVRARRHVLELTQTELAELAGVAVRTVHAVENDKPTSRLDALRAVLDAVGLRLTVERTRPLTPEPSQA